MKVININTGQEAVSHQWNLTALAELIIGFPAGDCDTMFSKDWVCACHHLPLGEDPEGSGRVMCKLEADRLLEEILKEGSPE